MPKGRGKPIGAAGGGPIGSDRRPRHAEERPKAAFRHEEDGGSPKVGASGAGTRVGVPPGHVLLGEFGRAHGLKGEVRLKSHTGDPLAIGRYGPLTAADGRTIVLGPLRRAPGEAPDMLVARVEGVTDRDGAEVLNRLALHCPRDRLGEVDAEEDEYFLADLIGLDAVAVDGTPIGPIVAVPNYGGGDLLEIAPPVGPTLLVPFTKAFVPTLDLAARRVTVAAMSLVEGDEESRDEDPQPPHAEVAGAAGPRSTHQAATHRDAHDPSASFEAPLRGAPQDEEGGRFPLDPAEGKGGPGRP